MLEIKQCRYKEPFRCIYVAQDNIDEFISDCLPWYKSNNGEKLERIIVKKKKLVEINYKYTKVNVFLDTWYINEGYKWEISENFSEDYDVIE